MDLLEKVNLIPKRSSKVIQRNSRVSSHSNQSLSLSFSDVEQQETSIEKLAYRFNQVSALCEVWCTSKCGTSSQGVIQDFVFGRRGEQCDLVRVEWCCGLCYLT